MTTWFASNSSGLEQKAYDAALQVRESVQMVENAMMEKDQVIVQMMCSMSIYMLLSETVC